MIRAYRPEDIEQVIEVWHAASLIATPFLSDAFLAIEKKRIRDQWMPRAKSWVFEEDERVLGFIALVGAEIGGIFVHPRSQGRGVGRALMDHVVSRRSRVVLSVFEDNGVGRRFYDRYGFEEVGRRVHAETGLTELRLEYDSR